MFAKKFFSKPFSSLVAVVFFGLSFLTSQAAQVAGGSTVTLAVTVDGTAPFAYQWRKDGVDMVGSTGPILTITNFQVADAGAYSVLVSNGAGSTPSDISNLTYVAPSVAPVIATQPLSQSVATGGNVTFSAVASGSPSPTYQWQKGGANIAGATSSSYTITGVSSGSAGSYSVVATNSAGSVTSSSAVLTVTTVSVAPAITTQPVSQSVTAGGNVTFSVVASGSPTPTYQWKKGGTNISGATSSSYTITGVSTGNAGTYTVVATNSAGSVTSSGAVLSVTTVNSAPSITKQPASQNLNVGDNLTLSVIATGYPAPTYQWRKNGINIVGATAATYTSANIQTTDGANYTVVVTNSIGSATSSAAVVNVALRTAKPGPSDFNNDGHRDLLWRDTNTGAIAFWLMNGTAFQASQVIGTVTLDWQIVGQGDFNGDGQTDILWENVGSGARGVWIMNGSTPAAWINLPSIALDWRIVGTGDFNGDGETDILWENVGSGDRGMWIMDGTVPVAWINLPSIALNWRIVGTGDFNGDGQTDILWENVGSGDRGMWIMNGTIPVAWVNLPSIALNWRIVDTGDFNGDGLTDILWENLVSGDRGMWIMNKMTPSAWISLPSIAAGWQLAK